MRSKKPLDFKNLSMIKCYVLLCIGVIMCTTACKNKSEGYDVVENDTIVSESRITPEEFWTTIQEKQSQIDKLGQGEKDAFKHYHIDDGDYLKSRAYQTNNPQFFVDYILARYDRTISKLCYAEANIAGQIAEIIRSHKDDYYLVSQVSGDIPPQEALEEGIAKYSDMREFFLEHADVVNTRYIKFLKQYDISSLIDISKDDLASDNDFLKQYGVTID